MMGLDIMSILTILLSVVILWSSEKILGSMVVMTTQMSFILYEFFFLYELTFLFFIYRIWELLNQKENCPWVITLSKKHWQNMFRKEIIWWKILWNINWEEVELLLRSNFWKMIARLKLTKFIKIQNYSFFNIFFIYHVFFSRCWNSMSSAKFLILCTII